MAGLRASPGSEKGARARRDHQEPGRPRHFHDRTGGETGTNPRLRGDGTRLSGERKTGVQVGVRVLWEIKVEYFDGYNDFLRRITVEREIEEFKEYRAIARSCGYAFKVGVISEAHKAALLDRDDTFDIVVTGCK
ncbi:DUF6310 domain-containing protein [Archangium sp.]|uniref:DUF6310 domain-containing protein n=1 Tax=Archangium sp. TaxID=1872627 RepID=UPI002D36CB65|nr:DUF6310 domain-containing protein [Archangium sp.]HYO55002.1 DUF6310 domain-containing protein [Archangium sp.]